MTDKPTISIIIPCRNDARYIGEVLAALTRQTYPSDCMEILVVDNGSTDNSEEVIRQYPVQRLKEEKPSAYRARNRALAAAKGDYILFLDADTVPADCWADELVHTALQHRSNLVGGRIENRISTATLGSALLAYTRSAERRKRNIVQYGRVSAGNMLVEATAFHQYGFFREVASGGDGEFSERINPEKKAVPYAEKAVVFHYCDISTIGYIKRTFGENRGQVQHGGRVLTLGSFWNLFKPGLRCAREVHSTLPANMSVSLPTVFLWLWLDRWAAFAGRAFGWVTGGGNHE